MKKWEKFDKIQNKMQAIESVKGGKDNGGYSLCDTALDSCLSGYVSQDNYDAAVII